MVKNAKKKKTKIDKLHFQMDLYFYYRILRFVRCHTPEQDGWPVGDLEFDPSLIIRGLVIDSELGNVVKANRFGYVMRAAHGTRMMDFEDQRNVYRQTPVELSDPRFIFLNTLFSLSETCLYSQLVDLFDDGALPGVMGYEDLYRKVRARMDETHLEGTLKAEITAEPGRFIDLDPAAGQALLDQKRAGKRLMLISNAEWEYAREIMAFAFDPYLEDGTTWRDLFERVVVGARKPGFFSYQLPLFSIADEDAGLLQPGIRLRRNAVEGGRDERSDRRRQPAQRGSLGRSPPKNL